MDGNQQVMQVLGSLYYIVPTPLRGNAPATLRVAEYGTAGAVKAAFPRSSARRYKQVVAKAAEPRRGSSH